MRTTNRPPRHRGPCGTRIPLTLLFLGIAAGLWSAPAPAADTAATGAAPVATGIVRITSPIPGAQVYIDNEPAGEAPFIRYLPVGAHTIRVAVDGFDPFVRRVDVVAGSTVDLSAQLLPGTGTVEFLVHPAGARVILNNDKPVPTPVRLPGLPEGNYTYRIEANGCEPEEGSFTFKKGQNLLFSRDLRVTAGLVEIGTDPPGARVWLDGESVGATPLSLEKVGLGPHVVRLEEPSHATVFRRFDNTDGSKGDVQVQMPSMGTQLSVATGLANATVSLNGNLMGTGDVVRINALEHGHYTLSVAAPDRQPVDLTIDVPEKGHKVFRADLKPLSEGGSHIELVHPLYARWTFWTLTAVGAGAVAGGAVALTTVLTPEPIPTSDTVVVLP